jgi:hypothetical protein
VDLTLDENERARLEAHSAPPPTYPRRLLIEQSGIGDVQTLTRTR